MAEPTFHISVTAKGGAALDVLRVLVSLADRVELLSWSLLDEEEVAEFLHEAPSVRPEPEDPYVEPTEGKPWGKCDICGVLVKRMTAHGRTDGWLHVTTPEGVTGHHRPVSLARFMTREGAEAWDGLGPEPPSQAEMGVRPHPDERLPEPSGDPLFRTQPPHPSGS